MKMNKRKSLIIIILCVIAAVILDNCFVEADGPDEARVTIYIPESWGAPVSVARRTVSATILFESGDVYIVRVGWVSGSAVHAVHMERVPG